MNQRQSRTRKTRVFHLTGVAYSDVPFFEQDDAFTLVAEVDTDDAREAFALTNSTERHWSQNRGVKALVEPCRSTSVGDVIITPDDEFYVVLIAGLRSLGKV